MNGTCSWCGVDARLRQGLCYICFEDGVPTGLNDLTSDEYINDQLIWG